MTFLEMLVVVGALYLIAAVVGGAALVAVYSKKEVRTHLLLTAAVALPLAYLVARVAGLFFYHEQPFASWEGEPLIPHATDNTFPSDHALLAVVLSSAVFIFNKWAGLALFVLTALIGVARVVAGLHYPVDIAAAFVLGIGVVATVYMVVRRFSLSTAP